MGMGIALALMAVNEADRTTAARLGRVGIVVLPVIMAAVLAARGARRGKACLLAKRYEASPFFAARPMTDRTLSRPSSMAAVSSLLAWALSLSLPAIWLMAPGNYARLADACRTNARHAGLEVGISRDCGDRHSADLHLEAVAARHVRRTLRPCLGGAVYGYVYGGLFPTILVFGGLALFWMPEYRPYAWRMAPWLVAAALAVKAILAPLAWRALVHRRIVPSGTLQKWLAFWCAAVAALTGLIVGIAPAGAISFGGALSGAIFLVPFNRLAVAPLAWNWNRHR